MDNRLQTNVASETTVQGPHVRVPERYLLERLISCCENGEQAETSFLIKYLENPLTRFTDNDFNALLVCVFAHQNPLLQYLLSSTFDPKTKCKPLEDLSCIKNKYDSTALHVATYRSNVFAFDILVQHAAYYRNLDVLINATDSWGKTVLHQAVYHNCAPIVARLLSLPEMDVHLKDANGKRAVDYCVFGKPVILQEFRNRDLIPADVLNNLPSDSPRDGSDCL